MPFNIFTGPAAKNYVDDPKNGFEKNADQIVNAIAHNNLSNLRDLHGNMRKYIDSIDSIQMMWTVLKMSSI